MGSTLVIQTVYASARSFHDSGMLTSSSYIHCVNFGFDGAFRTYLSLPSGLLSARRPKGIHSCGYTAVDIDVGEAVLFTHGAAEASDSPLSFLVRSQHRLHRDADGYGIEDRRPFGT